MANEIRVNRVILSDLPDIHNFKVYEGNDCFGIFSSGEVISMTYDNAKELGIDIENAQHTDLPKYLSMALESDDGKIKSKANEIVAELGQRLGAIFYVLKRDPKITVKSNTRYMVEDFDLWQKINNIFLVGGLANGALGRELASNAEKTLVELGFENIKVKAGKFPSDAQLVGVARLNDSKVKKAVVFDFGHTFVKSAVVEYGDGKLMGLKMLPKVPSEFMGRGFDTKEEEINEAQLLHQFIVNVITDAMVKNDINESSHIAISIANNAENGKIAWGGCYYKLMFIAENYGEYLADALSEAMGRRISVTLVHDGRAAALCFDEVENSAVFALGTAFGVGYTEGRHDLLDRDL